MIDYRLGPMVDYDRLITLFAGAGWSDKIVDPKRLQAMVENSQLVVTAWDGVLMVGFARCTTDHEFNGQINNVVVDPLYRKRGIGRQLIQRIVDSNGKVTYVLRADPSSLDFYRRLGFRSAETALVYGRKE